MPTLPSHRPHPRISANELAKFLEATPIGQEGIVRAAMQEGNAPAVRYRDLRNGLREYLGDPHRPFAALEACREKLERIRDLPTSSAFSRDDALASLPALSGFRDGMNSMGLNAIPFRPKIQGLPPLSIEGVIVSVSLDLIVQAQDRRKGDLVGGALLRISKASDIETEGAASKRRKIGRNAAVLVHMFAAESLANLGQPSARHCYSIDVHAREIIHAPSSYSAAEGNIKAACRAIRRMWDEFSSPG